MNTMRTPARRVEENHVQEEILLKLRKFLKDNSPEDSCPIEWEEFKEAFLPKYFPHERREVKVQQFINLNQGNMIVEEYSLKFSMLFRYPNILCLIQGMKCVIL